MTCDCKEVIQKTLAEYFYSPETGMPKAKQDLSLYAVKKRHILATLRSVGGNHTQAATILKISPRTVSILLKEYEGRTKK